jgi:hypothetical protein
VFHSKTTGKEYKIFCNVNCKTPNVVNLLDSRLRIAIRRRKCPTIQQKNEWTQKWPYVSQHFVSPGHSLDDFGRSILFIIDHNLSWKENQRQKRESFWIRELQTLHPEDLNKKA